MWLIDQLYKKLGQKAKISYVSLFHLENVLQIFFFTILIPTDLTFFDCYCKKYFAIKVERKQKNGENVF